MFETVEIARHLDEEEGTGVADAGAGDVVAGVADAGVGDVVRGVGDAGGGDVVRGVADAADPRLIVAGVVEDAVLRERTEEIAVVGHIGQ
eukprot:2361550-Pyramimonas_sp.AAC.2